MSAIAKFVDDTLTTMRGTNTTSISIQNERNDKHEETKYINKSYNIQEKMNELNYEIRAFALLLLLFLYQSTKKSL